MFDREERNSLEMVNERELLVEYILTIKKLFLVPTGFI
jgi:hypothetical protein